MPSGVAVLILGAVEARRASVPVPIPGRKLQALLSVLALSAPRPVGDGRLIDAVWGDELLSNPTNSLQAQISHLRRAIGHDVVVRRGSGYSLSVDPDDVDALCFERLVERSHQLARDGDQRSAAQGFQNAIELIRGPPLADLVDFSFARQAATRFEELLLAAHEGLADAELASGRHAELVVRLTELVRVHPLRERFHAQLIRALYRCGRQADALRAYSRAREILIEELGVEPGAELSDLQLAVLSHDPELAPPAGDDGGAAPPATPQHQPPMALAGAPRGHFRFVGRQVELNRLVSDLDDASAGRGRVAILAGEPGIGKSRLAEELASQAESRGVAVAWGRCYSGRGAPAFWPWTQAVQSLVAQTAPSVMIEALGSRAADVAQLVPEVHDLLPDLVHPPASDPESDRFRLCDALSRLLGVLALERPVLIVLDDLHWADASSLQMLSFLAGAILQAPLLIVATYRNVGTPTSGPLAETLADLARQAVVRHIDVVGLDRQAVRALFAASGPLPGEEPLEAVYRRTQGNPFFLVETLRLRSDDRACDDAVSIPTGVREVIRQRVGLLPKDTVAAMNAAAVLGSDFELAILAASLDVDPASSLRQLEPAFDAGLLTADHHSSGLYRFSHGLVRDTLYEDLGVAKRAMLHHRAGEALEAVYGASEGRHLVALAEQWFHAVPAAAPDRGIRYAVRSARLAQQHVGHEQAEQHLKAALALLAGMPEGRHRAELELEVQYELSVLLIMTEGYATPGVDLACARMRELCASIDDHSLLIPALWRLSISYLFSNDLDIAVGTGEQLLELAGPDGDPGPLLAGHMMLGMLLSHRGDVATARRHLDLATDLCRAGHDHHVAGFVAETPAVWIAIFSAWNWSLLGDDDRAEESALDAIDLATAVAARTNTYAKTFAIWVASLVATLRRDAVVTHRRCEEGIALARKGGFGMEFVPYMSAHSGWARAIAGDIDSGTAEIAAAAAAVQSSGGARMWRHVFAALLADAYLANGRFVEALSHSDEGLSQLGDTGARWFEAELRRLRGEALARLDASDPTAGKELSRAIAVARSQGSLLLERRAEASLAELPNS